MLSWASVWHKCTPHSLFKLANSNGRSDVRMQLAACVTNKTSLRRTDTQAAACAMLVERQAFLSGLATSAGWCCCEAPYLSFFVSINSLSWCCQWFPFVVELLVWWPMAPTWVFGFCEICALAACWFCKIKLAAPTAPKVPPPAAKEVPVLLAAFPPEPPPPADSLTTKSCTRFNLFCGHISIT